MNTTQTKLSDETERLLKALSEKLGVTPAEALRDAVQAYAMQIEDDELPVAEWHAALDAMCGMWKDRDDLPDFDALRKSWDRNVWGDRENKSDTPKPF